MKMTFVYSLHNEGDKIFHMIFEDLFRFGKQYPTHDIQVSSDEQTKLVKVELTPEVIV